MRKIIFKKLVSQKSWCRDISISEITAEADTLTEAQRGTILAVERVSYITLEPVQFYILKKEDSKTGEYVFCYEAHSVSFSVIDDDIYKITQVSYHKLKIREQKTPLNLGGCHGKF